MAPQQFQLLELAADILAHTRYITAKLQSSGFKEPTFLEDTPRELWEKNSLGLASTKVELVEAARTLIKLVEGPMLWIDNLLLTPYDLASFQVLLECNVINTIPLQGSISLSDLSKAVDIDEDRLGRMIRLLVTQHFLDEVSDGVFAHTCLSASIAKDADLRALVELHLGDMHRASVESADYFISQRNKVQESSPFQFKYGMPLYDWYEKHTDKAVRFAAAHKGGTKVSRGMSTIFTWIQQGDERPTTIVDVGGGSGHVALSLAKEFPDMKFIVQDLYETMFSETSKNTDLELLKRVTFAKHDYFSPQVPDSSISAYLLRSCLHNRGDEEGIQMIRAFVPALEMNPNVALLINEIVIPDSGIISLHEEQNLREADIAMLVIANAKQRTEKEWRALLRAADPRLRVVSIVRDRGAMSLIEVRI